MGMKNRIKDAWNALTRPAVSLDEEELLKWLGIEGRQDRQAINEATYFTCLKMLSETMGKLPLKFYQQTEKGKIRADPNRAARLLLNRPNRIMTPATFWATVEMNCEHYGNAFVWLQTKLHRSGRYGGEYQVESFWPMQSNCVQVTMDDAGVFGEKGYLYYEYTDPYSGEFKIIPQKYVLHFKTWCTLNGILGKSVQDMLKDTVDGASESQNYQNNLYRQNMTVGMALQYTGNLDKKHRDALVAEYSKMMTGSKNIGKVIPVPIGMTLQPLNIKLTDAQFFELKKYTALQIAAAFGIKPNQLNDYDKASYANSETQQLAFLVDTMSYRLAQYEQELNYKCLSNEERAAGYYFKFNEKAILRTDAQTQMQTLVSAVTNGLYTINEAREYLDLPKVDGGDTNMVNGTYQPITQVGAAYGVNNGSTEPRGGEGDGS